MWGTEAIHTRVGLFGREGVKAQLGKNTQQAADVGDSGQGTREWAEVGVGKIGFASIFLVWYCLMYFEKQQIMKAFFFVSEASNLELQSTSFEIMNMWVPV